MIAIAKASDTEREVLFGNAAYRAEISNSAIVEKDFWVCFAFMSHRGYQFESQHIIRFKSFFSSLDKNDKND